MRGQGQKEGKKVCGGVKFPVGGKKQTNPSSKTGKADPEKGRLFPCVPERDEKTREKTRSLRRRNALLIF